MVFIYVFQCNAMRNVNINYVIIVFAVTHRLDGPDVSFYIYIYICLTSKAPCTDQFDWLNIIALQSNMGVALISQSSWGERSSN